MSLSQFIAFRVRFLMRIYIHFISAILWQRYLKRTPFLSDISTPFRNSSTTYSLITYYSSWSEHSVCFQNISVCTCRLALWILFYFFLWRGQRGASQKKRIICNISNTGKLWVSVDHPEERLHLSLVCWAPCTLTGHNPFITVIASGTSTHKQQTNMKRGVCSPHLFMGCHILRCAFLCSL